MNQPMTEFPLGQKLLNRWGSAYIPRMQLIVQLVSFVAASGGIVYILLNVKFTLPQIQALFAGVFVLVIAANVILLPAMAAVTPNARRRLKRLAGKSPAHTADPQQEIMAWREITNLPWRFGLAASAVALFVVILPISLFMYFSAGATFEESIHTAIGGVLSATILVALDTLLLEYVMTPPRLVLLPPGYEAQIKGLAGTRLQTRILIIVSAVTIITLLTIAPRSYQEAVNALTGTPGDHTQAVRGLQMQMIVTAIAAFLATVGFALFLSRSVYRPMQALLGAINEVERGRLDVRSEVLGTDETGALAIQFNHMIERIESLQTSLENQVALRTAQLEAVIEVGRAASAILDPDILIERVVNLITDRFGHYYAAIFLLDATGRWAELKSATGETGRVLRESRHRLAADSRSMVGTAVSQKQARIALDVGQEPVRFNNPLLPYTRSEIALPLMVGDHVLGALDVQSTRETAFGQEDIQTLQSMANQVAVALENARLFQETTLRLQELQSAQRQYLRESWSALTAKSSLEYSVGDEFASATETAINVPLALRDEVIGQINMSGEQDWSTEERAWVEAVATQAAIALENARLMEESRKQAGIERTVAEITTRVWSANSIDGILQTAVKEIGRALNLSEATIELNLGAEVKHE